MHKVSQCHEYSAVNRLLSLLPRLVCHHLKGLKILVKFDFLVFLNFVGKNFKSLINFTQVCLLVPWSKSVTGKKNHCLFLAPIQLSSRHFFIAHD